MSEDLEFAEEKAAPAPAERAPEVHGVNGAHQKISPQEATEAMRSGLSAAGPAETKVLVPPHSVESELALLSCILLDAGSVLPRCAQGGIEPKSFYIEAHGVIYDCARQMHAAGIPVDGATVSAQLRDSRQLKGVGGEEFMQELGRHQPTTSYASKWVGDVRQQAVLRGLIAEGQRLVESAYGFHGLPAEFTEFLEDNQRRIESASENRALGDVLTRRAFDPKVTLDKPTAIFTLGGTTICTPGNLTTIFSVPKVGKTAAIGGMLAATITRESTGDDTLGFAGANFSRHAVIHFDTEQSPYDWQQMLRTALKRCGLKEPPPWLMSYSLTGLPAAECRRLVDVALRLGKRKFGGIHSMIIDGSADLVVDPNDPGECFPLVTSLHGQAIAYNTAIINVIHLNPGTEKTRGHLGSQLERKSESNIMMEKDGDTTLVYGLKQRGKMITRADAAAFCWSDEKGMHATCEAPVEEGKNKGGRPRGFTFSQIAPFFPAPNEKPVQRAMIEKSALEAVYGLKKGTFHRMIADGVADGHLVRVPDKIFTFVYRRA